MRDKLKRFILSLEPNYPVAGGMILTLITGCIVMFIGLFIWGAIRDPLGALFFTGMLVGIPTTLFLFWKWVFEA